MSGLLGSLAVLSILGLRYRSDAGDLAPSAITESLQRLESAFGVMDRVVLVVTTEKDGEESCLVEFARTLAKLLDSEPLVRSVRYGWAGLEGDLSADLLARAPLFATRASLSELDELLTPEGIQEAVRKLPLMLGMPGLGEAEAWIEKDPLELRRFVLSRVREPGSGPSFASGSGYFLSEDRRTLLVRVEGQVSSSDITQVKALVASVRRAEQHAREAVAARCSAARDFEIGYTGGYAFAVESERVLRADLTRGVFLSFGLVVLTLGVAWRRPSVLLLSVVTLCYGILLGYGAFSVLRREVVTLAMVSGALLAAVGIDFVIHVAGALRVGSGPIDRVSLSEAMLRTGPSISLAALTTAVAFLCFVLVSDGFLADFGLLTALGIAGTLLSTVLVFPALLSLSYRGGARGSPRAGAVASSSLGRSSLEYLASGLAAWSRRRRTRVLAMAALSVVGGIVFLFNRPPQVESDLRRVHDPSSEPLRWETRLSEAFGTADDPVLLIIEAPEEDGSTTTGRDGPSVSAQPSLEEQRLLEALSRLTSELDELEQAGTIAGCFSPLQLIPPPSNSQEPSSRRLHESARNGFIRPSKSIRTRVSKTPALERMKESSVSTAPLFAGEKGAAMMIRVGSDSVSAAAA